MDIITNEQKLNLGQLSSINFIVSILAEISEYNNITEDYVAQLLSNKANIYLKNIPYGKAKELIRLVLEFKDIVKTI